MAKPCARRLRAARNADGVDGSLPAIPESSTLPGSPSIFHTQLFAKNSHQQTSHKCVIFAGNLNGFVSSPQQAIPQKPTRRLIYLKAAPPPNLPEPRVPPPSFPATWEAATHSRPGPRGEVEPRLPVQQLIVRAAQGCTGLHVPDLTLPRKYQL